MHLDYNTHTIFSLSRASLFAAEGAIGLLVPYILTIISLTLGNCVLCVIKILCEIEWVFSAKFSAKLYGFFPQNTLQHCMVFWFGKLYAFLWPGKLYGFFFAKYSVKLYGSLLWEIVCFFVAKILIFFCDYTL